MSLPPPPFRPPPNLEPFQQPLSSSDFVRVSLVSIFNQAVRFRHRPLPLPPPTLLLHTPTPYPYPLKTSQIKTRMRRVERNSGSSSPDERHLLNKY
ncbi:hypothetical protein CEXT_94301 [Caerostris extrusa]|uniref:Uncharacterized protein n=1 Tax=Caerostris extrusa TaxID=172846 RepID=A0AAV4UDH9_CAEEX|nr:hypothetical protein CEXT_94301 [Caerostris extrusa]